MSLALEGGLRRADFAFFFLSSLSSTQEPSLTLQLFMYYLHMTFISTLYFFIYHYLSFDLPILSHHIFFCNFTYLFYHVYFIILKKLGGLVA